MQYLPLNLNEVIKRYDTGSEMESNCSRRNKKLNRKNCKKKKLINFIIKI